MATTPEECIEALREPTRRRIRRGRGRPQRAWVTRYKRDSDGCIRCDEDDPSCLDLHHPGGKDTEVGRMVSNRRPIPEIRAEVERCELFCANCHRREHHEPPASSEE